MKKLVLALTIITLTVTAAFAKVPFNCADKNTDDLVSAGEFVGSSLNLRDLRKAELNDEGM